MSKSDCIEWTGAINSSGYGITWKDGKTCYAQCKIWKDLADE